MRETPVNAQQNPTRCRSGTAGNRQRTFPWIASVPPDRNEAVEVGRLYACEGKRTTTVVQVERNAKKRGLPGEASMRRCISHAVGRATKRTAARYGASTGAPSKPSTKIVSSTAGALPIALSTMCMPSKPISVVVVGVSMPHSVAMR